MIRIEIQPEKTGFSFSIEASTTSRFRLEFFASGAAGRQTTGELAGETGRRQYHEIGWPVVQVGITAMEVVGADEVPATGSNRRGFIQGVAAGFTALFLPPLANPVSAAAPHPFAPYGSLGGEGAYEPHGSSAAGIGYAPYGTSAPPYTPYGA